jgi:hypothetical protein
VAAGAAVASVEPLGTPTAEAVPDALGSMPFGASIGPLLACSTPPEQAVSSNATQVDDPIRRRERMEELGFAMVIG